MLTTSLIEYDSYSESNFNVCLIKSSPASPKTNAKRVEILIIAPSIISVSSLAVDS